jgi:hypothetical protein
MAATDPRPVRARAALAALAWVFFTFMRRGDVTRAAQVLRLFQETWNSYGPELRAAPYFAEVDAAIGVPRTVPATGVYDGPTRLALQTIIYGEFDRLTGAAVAEMPESAGAVGHWFAAQVTSVYGTEHYPGFLSTAESGGELGLRALVHDVIDGDATVRQGAPGSLMSQMLTAEERAIPRTPVGQRDLFIAADVQPEGGLGRWGPWVLGGALVVGTLVFARKPIGRWFKRVF